MSDFDAGTFKLKQSAEEAHAGVSPATYRDGMRLLAGACSIVTSHFDGTPAGMTATAICSMTADPPRLLVCVNRACWAHKAICSSRLAAVNVLASEHEGLARRFAGLSPSSPWDRFQPELWTTGVLGVPLLQDALAILECNVVDCLDGTTHSLFVCEVVSIQVSPRQTPQPLLYFDRSFARLVGLSSCDPGEAQG